jgi:hypothetical protein
MPQRRHVLRQAPDRVQLRRLQPDRLACQVAGVLGLQCPFGGKGRLPVPFQRARDQPHVGVHRLVAPAREGCLVAHPFQALRPVPMLGCALKLDVFGHLQADLNGRWCQGREDQLSHQRVHRLGAERQAARSAKRHRLPGAQVAGLASVVAVGQRRAPAAADQAAQQGRAASGDAVVLGAVRRHLLLVALVGRPVNVSRPAVPAQHRLRWRSTCYAGGTFANFAHPSAARMNRRPLCGLPGAMARRSIWLRP